MTACGAEHPRNDMHTCGFDLGHDGDHVCDSDDCGMRWDNPDVPSKIRPEGSMLLWSAADHKAEALYLLELAREVDAVGERAGPYSRQQAIALRAQVHLQMSVIFPPD